MKKVAIVKVKHKRVERAWPEEGLNVPKKQPQW
jgi:hypothetical protein